MKTHEAANAFPMMDDKRYIELREDIRLHGLFEPIMLCDGKILDGRNRYKACLELGIKTETKRYEGDPWDYVWSLNGQRRDLTAEQRYLVWKFVYESGEAWRAEQQRIRAEANQKRSEAMQGVPYAPKGVERKPEKVVEQVVPPPLDKHKSKKAKAAASKTNAGAVARGDKLAKDRPDLAEKVRLGKLSSKKAYKQMMKDKQVEELAQSKREMTEQAKAGLPKICDIRVCSMRELLLSGIKPDCLITDPPYSAEYLPLYEELAQLSKNIPLVAVMCGQTYLPTIFESMCRHLKYRWTLCYLTPGGQSVQQFPSKVNTFWKPVLLFGEAVEWIGDVTASKVNDNDKRFHDWGQSESGMADLIDRLTKPGQLVCDPFVGAGTTAVTSITRGRRFVGCDIDHVCVRGSMIRVEANYAASQV